MKPLILLSLLTLTACGFSPVYGTGNQSASNYSSASLNQIRINPLPDREGQYLRNALIDRFHKNGYPSAPAYSLNVGKLNERKTAFDITVESEATRYQLKISAPITLTNIKTGENILTRKLNAVSSYNVLESEFATRVSEQSAREAILDDLARQIEQHIALMMKK